MKCERRINKTPCGRHATAFVMGQNVCAAHDTAGRRQLLALTRPNRTLRPLRRPHREDHMSIVVVLGLLAIVCGLLAIGSN